MGSKKHKEKSKDEKEKKRRAEKNQKVSDKAGDEKVRKSRADKIEKVDERICDANKKRTYEREEEQERLRAKKTRVDESDEGLGSTSQGAGDVLSIAETNKLREKLGLAPLQLDDKPVVKDVEGSDGVVSQENVYTEHGVQFVHKPAKNWNDARLEEKLREKLEATKEKRKIHEKLNSMKLLSSADDGDDDSAASWVLRSRKIEEEKRLAIERAKILEELDKDFGIGDIIQEQKRAKDSKAYTSKDLKGLTVEHSLENLAEGSETILVLQDQDVLGDGEDVLVNPTIKEQEKWTQNAELRKKKTGYDPFQDDFDEFGNYQEKKLLGKYDEVIDGQSKESFKLDAHGSIDADYKAIIADKLKARLKEGSLSLEMAPAQLATEFYTKEEMARFKKPKKKIKKVRRRGGTIEEESELTAEDLLKTTESAKDDFGSRKRGRGRVKLEYEETEPPTSIASEVQPKINVDLSSLKMASESEEDADELYNDLTGIMIEDEAENELHSVLHRTRLFKQMEPQVDAEDSTKNDKAAEEVLNSLIKQEAVDEFDDAPPLDAKAVVLNTTSEYCRGLGDIPTYGMAGNRDDVDVYQQDSALANIKQESASEDSEDELQAGDDNENRNKWVRAGFGQANSDAADSDEEAGARPPILEDEPVTSGSVVAALELAKKKGYLEPPESDDHGPSKLAHLEAQRFTVIDKQFHDIDDKYAKKLERMGGHGGPVMDFREKSNYKPNIKLEYADKKGNLMDAKEAFRYLSWKFHGKKPGKRKTEKRIVRKSEVHKLNQMSSTDTPLGTLSKQIDKQKQLNLPYILLSGTGSKEMTTSIKKD